MHIGIKELKLSLFAEDKALYIEYSQEFTKNLLELVNEFSKVAAFKINIPKSVVFIYIRNGQSEKKIKETILLKIITKQKKFSNKFNERMLNLQPENYKTLFMDQNTSCC